jgi:hypothetical protein
VVAEEHVDGEALAAWTAGTLPALDASKIERHLADCPRCQSMLAVFARTAPPVAAAAPWWQRWNIRWLVPLATAATIAGIWVALPDRSFAPEPTVAQRADVPLAPERQEPAPAPPTPPQAKPQTNTFAARQAEPPPPLAAEPAPAPARPAPRERAEAAAEAGQRAVAALPSAPTVTAATPAPAAPPAAAPAPPAATPAAPPAPATVETMAESVTVQDKLGRTAAFGSGATAVEFASPDAATRWRIVAGSRVERSTDAGRRWNAVAALGSTRLIAGHAPSVNVVWLVGDAGAIYVTSDGARFARVPFVESTNLAAVVAVDDRQATVTAADGRVFRTTDRGATWMTP